MAFDQATRNRLQRFVSEARALLTKEFTRQLQEDYGITPGSGEVAAMETLSYLDNVRRETARILRVTLEHYRANSPGSSTTDLLERIVREQAFTVLNRLAALRMAEAREFITESIAKGYESRGFQLYIRLAGTGLGETGDAYRSYLFSLFDEFALDLRVLFDRFSPMGRLFPNEPELLKLLKLMNDPEITDLWAEDETIGWIYQYFNSKDERKKMRDESAAPRNSRELAVRNQFFTPRYVVEFLTDNTLGRIWYEMTQGETALKDRCRYLVRRPTEIFLQEGVAAPESLEAEESLSQEELLKQPVYIPHRSLKDPREIRMLDPACGSMHFGLYAFDLYECIYEEAWDLQAAVVGSIGSGQWTVGSDQQETLTTENRPLPTNTNRQGIREDDSQELSGTSGLAEGDGSGRGNLSGNQGIPEGRNVWFNESDSTSSSFDPIEYCGGTGEELDEGISASSFDLLRFATGGRNSDFDSSSVGLSDQARSRGANSIDEGNRSLDQRAVKRALTSAGWSLTTDHRPLILDYPSKEAFLRDVPRLIIEHNIHGVDIDPRAVQIAGLSLWLRAQKSWQAQELKLSARPQIQKSNVVCAEPMPGEERLLNEFLEEHLADTPEQKLVGQLVRRVFEATKLAGEAGSLLQIEQEISKDVEAAKLQWLNRPKSEQLTLSVLEAQPKQQELPLMIDEITDEYFWERVEGETYRALNRYAEQADLSPQGGNSYQRRLFANDAVRGFALIDLCRKKFDVALMNPPFGVGSTQTKAALERTYPRTKNDVYAAFIERGLQLLGHRGQLGAITSRTGFFLSSFQRWREEILLKEATPTVMADLGYGVLDAAMVETAAYCLSKEVA
jgi:hypothetical protein